MIEIEVRLRNMTTTTTVEEMKAAKAVLLAVGDTIREVGEVPSGVLYSMLMGRIDLGGYEAMIGILKRAGLVEETSAHVLRWIGKSKGGAR